MMTNPTETHEEEKTFDCNCDPVDVGVMPMPGISRGEEMATNPIHKLSTTPLAVAGNGIIDNPAAQLALISSPHSHDHSYKIESNLNHLTGRVAELEHQMESLQWDVRSSITCQV